MFNNNIHKRDRQSASEKKKKESMSTLGVKLKFTSKHEISLFFRSPYFIHPIHSYLCPNVSYYHSYILPSSPLDNQLVKLSYYN